MSPIAPPVFVAGINKLGKALTDFRAGQVEVIQQGVAEYFPASGDVRNASAEERNRQVAMAILGGVAAAANSYSASQAGYGSFTTHGGRTGTFYSTTSAAIAQGNAAAQNEAMFAGTIESGQHLDAWRVVRRAVTLGTAD